ncbi:MAG: LptE family protein [Candidatus Cloacimonetes bacterium]|nr:LptE family protein [Candidatus Cloacimonadota bacterium]
MKRYYWFIIIICYYFCGCGAYSFYTRSNPHLKTVMISEFENDSEQYSLPELITTYLTEYFIADNLLEVMGDNADMDVTGTIISYDKTVFSYDMQEEPKEWQITIHFSIKVKDLVKDNTIWETQDLTLRSIYGNPENKPEDESENDIEVYTEMGACRNIIDELGDIILSNTVEQW